MDLNTAYDMTDFEKKFKAFTKEDEFGTSFYMIAYEREEVDSDLKDFILIFKYRKWENFNEISINHVPPVHMIKLKELVEKYSPNCETWEEVSES